MDEFLAELDRHRLTDLLDDPGRLGLPLAAA